MSSSFSFPLLIEFIISIPSLQMTVMIMIGDYEYDDDGYDDDGYDDDEY